jgi:hypothetical protein
VTVIATSFPADMPRKSLFAGAQEGKLVKDESPAVLKKEINNVIQAPAGTSSDGFLKRPEKKVEVVEDIIDDSSDDWSAVPAFLRRKK